MHLKPKDLHDNLNNIFKDCCIAQFDFFWTFEGDSSRGDADAEACRRLLQANGHALALQGDHQIKYWPLLEVKLLMTLPVRRSVGWLVCDFILPVGGEFHFHALFLSEHLFYYHWLPMRSAHAQCTPMYVDDILYL